MRFGDAAESYGPVFGLKKVGVQPNATGVTSGSHVLTLARRAAVAGLQQLAPRLGPLLSNCIIDCLTFVQYPEY